MFSARARCLATICSSQTRLKSKVADSTLVRDQPIPFLSSKAAQRFVSPSVIRTEHNHPWYQPYAVLGSVTAFLLYFCVFRQENDVDLKFNQTLYEKIEGLEKQQLLQAYQFNKEHGKSVLEIEQRLRELEAQQAAKM